MLSDCVMESLEKEDGDGGERATFLRFDVSPPLTPPNSPTQSGPLRSALRRALSVGQADKRGHGPLVPSAARVDLAGDDASATATPLLSHLPSSANLVALDEEPDAAARVQAGRKGGVVCLSRAPLLLLLLYGFVCSLDLLTTSFRLMAGKAAGAYVGSSRLHSPQKILISGPFHRICGRGTHTNTCSGTLIHC